MERLWPGPVGKGCYYGVLASLRGRFFQYAGRAAFCCTDNGRDHAIALLSKGVGRQPRPQGMLSTSL